MTKPTSGNSVTTFLSPPSISLQIGNYREIIIGIQNNDQFHPEKYDALQRVAAGIAPLMMQYGTHPFHQADLAVLQRQLIVAMRVYAPDPDEGLQAYAAEVQLILAIQGYPAQKEERLQILQQEMASFVNKYQSYILHRDGIAALRIQLSEAIEDCRQSTYLQP